jgi:hypothetical protein
MSPTPFPWWGVLETAICAKSISYLSVFSFTNKTDVIDMIEIIQRSVGYPKEKPKCIIFKCMSI